MVENRFKNARTKLNKNGFQSVQDVKRETGLGDTMIDALESETSTRGVSYLAVKKLASYYGVSMDYLAGLTDIPAAKTEIRAICEYTGLSESAVEALHFMSNADMAEQRRSLSFVNKVLSDEDLIVQVKSNNRDSMLQTLFSLLDQYVTADTVERALDFERLFETGEKPEARYTDDFLKRFIAIRSSEDLSEMIDVPGLYSEFKMTQIRKLLDDMRSKQKEESK